MPEETTTTSNPLFEASDGDLDSEVKSDDDEVEEVKAKTEVDNDSPFNSIPTDEFPAFLKKAHEVAKLNPNLIKSNPIAAREAFGEISKVLFPETATEGGDPGNVKKIDAIDKILKGEGEGEGEEKKIDDFGLIIFAELAKGILGMNKENSADNEKILAPLVINFFFLSEESSEENNPIKSFKAILETYNSRETDEGGLRCKEELGKIINSALSNFLPVSLDVDTTRNEVESTENQVEGGLNQESTTEGQKLNGTPKTKEGLTPEEQELVNNREINWSNAIEIMPDAFRGGTALALALAVPAPFGVILAIGFLACAWNMGHKPEEENLYNDPLIKDCSTAWKNFMEEQKSKSDESVSIEASRGGREITAEDRINNERNPTRTGKAADEVIGGSAKDLEEDKKALVTTSEALRVNKTESATNSAELNEKLITELEEAVKSEITKSNIEEKNVLVEKKSEAIDARDLSLGTPASSNLQDDAGPISGEELEEALGTVTTESNIEAVNIFVEDNTLKGVTEIDGLQVAKNTIRNSSDHSDDEPLNLFVNLDYSQDNARSDSFDRPQPSNDHSNNNPLGLFVDSEEEESSEEEVQTAEDYYSELINNKHIDEDEEQAETNREEYNDPPIGERLEAAKEQALGVVRDISAASSLGEDNSNKQVNPPTARQSNTDLGR